MEEESALPRYLLNYRSTATNLTYKPEYHVALLKTNLRVTFQNEQGRAKHGGQLVCSPKYPLKLH